MTVAIVWMVQHDGTNVEMLYPYPDLGVTTLTNTALEAIALTTTAATNASTGKSIYVNDKKYRMPMWAANTGANLAGAFNCANNALCLFIALKEPKGPVGGEGEKSLSVEYKYSRQISANAQGEEFSGFNNNPSLNPLVEVAEVGSDRFWSTTLDGSPSISFGSTTEIHECSKRGLCDYATGQCKCFDGYSGRDCGKRSSLGLA